jgi:outer membrane protein assembly factor BamB
MADIIIKNVMPRAALPGGEVLIEYAGRELAGTSQPQVRFGDFSAQITMASSDHILAKVPESSSELGTSELVVATNGDTSRPFPYEIGKKIASNLHPVANPAIDGEGNVYATYSGRRGQKTPVSIYKVTPKGAVTPYVTDIMNATGLAFSLTGDLFVSSRFEGNVYRVDRAGRTELFIEGMGIASGMAFDHDGNLYVGDRSGSIFKISASKEIFVFATLEPSVAAYHLAFGFDDYLYVSGPTTSSFDSIYRISPSGEVDRFYTGLGRPQGLAFDIEGTLYAVASYRGRRGIFRFRDPKKPELVVAGLSLVGMAFDLKENLMVADAGSLYRVRLGTLGKPLP